MLVNRTDFFQFCAILLIALMPMNAKAQDASIGGVPVPKAAKPAQGSSPFLGAWFGTWGATWRTVLVVESVEGATITATFLLIA